MTLSVGMMSRLYPQCDDFLLVQHASAALDNIPAEHNLLGMQDDLKKKTRVFHQF